MTRTDVDDLLAVSRNMIANHSPFVHTFAFVRLATPQAVAALCKIAIAAAEWHRDSNEGHDALDDALKDAGLIK